MTTTEEELKEEIERRCKANKYYAEKIANIDEETDFKFRTKRKELWEKEGFKIYQEVREILELKAELKGRQEAKKEIEKEFIKKFYFKNHVLVNIELIKEFRKYLNKKSRQRKITQFA